MARCIMCHFVCENASEFGFIIGSFEQASLDEEVPARERKCIDFARLQDRDVERDLQVGLLRYALRY